MKEREQKRRSSVGYCESFVSHLHDKVEEKVERHIQSTPLFMPKLDDMLYSPCLFFLLLLLFLFVFLYSKITFHPTVYHTLILAHIHIIIICLMVNKCLN